LRPSELVGLAEGVKELGGGKKERFAGVGNGLSRFSVCLFVVSCGIPRRSWQQRTSCGFQVMRARLYSKAAEVSFAVPISVEGTDVLLAWNI